MSDSKSFDVTAFVDQYQLNQFRFTGNWFTYSRFIPLIMMVYFYYCHQWGVGGWCYIAAIVPDWCDGPFARWQKRRSGVPLLTLAQEQQLTWWQRMNLPGASNLGAFMDPFLDKAMNSTALFMLLKFMPWYMAGMVLVIIVLDLALQFVVRPLKIRWGIKDAAKANNWGKYKTQAQGWTAGFMPFVYTWAELLGYLPRTLQPVLEAGLVVGLLLAIYFAFKSIQGHLWPKLEPVLV